MPQELRVETWYELVALVATGIPINSMKKESKGVFPTRASAYNEARATGLRSEFTDTEVETRVRPHFEQGNSPKGPFGYQVIPHLVVTQDGVRGWIAYCNLDNLIELVQRRAQAVTA